MPEHTEGPFEKAAGGNNTIAIVTADQNEFHKLVASVAVNRPIDEAEANANLFAAAPDLLKAAECILGDLSAVMPAHLVQHFGASRQLLLLAVEKARQPTWNEKFST